MKTFLNLAREAFGYVLIFYLVLFLLENLLPGFVSNNFSLNWVLVAVLVNGFVAAFAPEKEEEEDKIPGRSDYLLILVLAIIGGAIIYAKADMSMPLRLTTTLVSAGLIMLVGFVTLFGKDEEPAEEMTEEPSIRREYHGAPAIRWSEVWIKVKQAVRPLFLHRVQIPFVYVLLFVIVTAVLIPKNITRLSTALSRPPMPAGVVPTPTPEMPPFFWDDMNLMNDFAPSGEIHIAVQNGGGQKGVAASVSAILREAGFTNITAGNANRYDYINALILFHPEDKPQASVVKRYLEEEYSIVLEAPADASASGITVILGAQEGTEKGL